MSEPTNRELPPEHEDKPTGPSFMPAPTGHTLPAPSLAEVVKKNIERAGFPELNETVMAAEIQRGIAHIRAGTALPVDGNASKGDGYFLDDLTHCKQRLQRLRTLVDEAEETSVTLRRRFAELTPPLSFRQWLVVVGALLIVTTFGVFTLKSLLASSFDELLLRAYFDGLGIPEPEAASAAQAERLVLWAGTFMLGGKALAVVSSSGRLTFLMKSVLIGIAVLFSGAFAAVRLSLGWSFAALAVSLVELAILSSFSLLLVVIAAVLRSSQERGEAYRSAQGSIAVAEQRVREQRSELEAITRDYESRRLALAQREDDCRRLPLYEAVAERTVEAETLVATAELITKTATAAYAGVAGSEMADAPTGQGGTP